MDNNNSGGFKGGLGGLFGGGSQEYSNTELAGVPCKYPVAIKANALMLILSRFWGGFI